MFSHFHAFFRVEPEPEPDVRVARRAERAEPAGERGHLAQLVRQPARVSLQPPKGHRDQGKQQFCCR